MFTYLFGGALAGSTGDYLQFLLPGTLVLAVVFVTVYSGVTLNRDLATGAFDRFRSLPVWRPAPIVGGLIGDVGRYLLAPPGDRPRPDHGLPTPAAGRSASWPPSPWSSSSPSRCPGCG